VQSYQLNIPVVCYQRQEDKIAQNFYRADLDAGNITHGLFCSSIGLCRDNIYYFSASQLYNCALFCLQQKKNTARDILNANVYYGDRSSVDPLK
jgi:hypothetical protein